jgi:hypothetical protein
MIGIKLQANITTRFISLIFNYTRHCEERSEWATNKEPSIRTDRDSEAQLTRQSKLKIAAAQKRPRNDTLCFCDVG